MNFRALVASTMPTVLRTNVGRRLAGTLALVHDVLATGMVHAVRAAWIGDVGIGPAYDALQPGGQELALPRYPIETWPQYHARLQRAWLDWPFAGDESSIVGQLAAAGFPGVQIQYLSDIRFNVFFPFGSHPVAGPGALVGSFVVGDGTIVGVTGITPIELRTTRAIIRKFKPGHWRAVRLRFELEDTSIAEAGA